MKISQLQAFVAVAQRNSFSEAAKALGISQPSATVQVQSLEAELGVTLFDRRYRGVELTESGRALLPHASSVLAQLEQAAREVRGLSDVVSGRLTVAASTTPGAYIVPALLGTFVSRYPEVGVAVTVGDSVSVAHAVESGEAHIGITGAEVRGFRVRFEPVGQDSLVLIARTGSPILSREGVELADLCDEPWVMREAGSGTRQVTETLLSEHGVDPSELRVLAEFGTGEAIVSAVEGGLGLAVVSQLVAAKAIALGTVGEVDARGFPATRPLYAVHSSATPTRAAAAFELHLREALR